MKKKGYVILAAIAFGLFIGVAAYFGWLSYAELMYEDILYQTQDKINNQIKIIAIDDRSLREMGDFNSWSRKKYADLVHILNNDKGTPAIIAFDIMLMDNKDEEGDLAFVKACEASENVVLASKLDTSVKYDLVNQNIDTMYINGCMQPYEPLNSMVDTGFVNIIMDNDGYVRHALAAMSGDGGIYYSFSAAIYRKYMNLLGKAPTALNNGSFLIDYSAIPGSYEMISFCDVLNGTVPASVFKDCIVLIGGCTEGLMDSYNVPIERRALMYGVEINANIVQALIDGKSLVYANRLISSLVTGIFAALFLYFSNEKKIRYMTLSLVCMIIGHIAVCFGMIKAGIIVPLLYMLLAFVLAYIINLIWKYVYERRQRTKELHEMLFSMAEAMTEAIDGRTPYNASHTRKVAQYAVSLAEYINERHKSKATKLHFCENDLEQLRLAALLHDVGKLDVPIEVLDKSSRLGPNYDPLLQKLDTIRLYIRLDGANGVISKKEEQERLTELDKLKSFIIMINVKEWLSDEEKQFIEKARKLTYPDEDGNPISYLSDTQYQCLVIAKGTLTPEEIEKVHEHVIYTEKILSKVRFGVRYNQVKEIAASHHEFLNGCGYPNKLSDKEISPLVRILTIADIYDALTADDRPYKRAKSMEVSFQILKAMERENAIDGEILRFAKELWGTEIK